MGDRLYVVHDVDGKIARGKSTPRFCRINRLFKLVATYDEDVPIIRFPGGGTVRGDDANIHHALSGFLEQMVTLACEEINPNFDSGPVHIDTTSALARLQ